MPESAVEDKMSFKYVQIDWYSKRT